MQKKFIYQNGKILKSLKIRLSDIWRSKLNVNARLTDEYLKDKINFTNWDQVSKIISHFFV